METLQLKRTDRQLLKQLEDRIERLNDQLERLNQNLRDE